MNMRVVMLRAALGGMLFGLVGLVLADCLVHEPWERVVIVSILLISGAFLAGLPAHCTQRLSRFRICWLIFGIAVGSLSLILHNVYPTAALILVLSGVFGPMMALGVMMIVACVRAIVIWKRS
jgi:hypothetical protein